MRAAADFNYKVALASGLSSLRGGKLRHAEEQFRYLITKFPTADGGYRGLAKVQSQQDDAEGALFTLRQGAAACAKAGERSAAIALLREAVSLGPLDATIHRHLAAALALAGDAAAAVREYARFADAMASAGQDERARLEIAYAVERMPHDPDLLDLARRFGVSLEPAAPAAPAAPVAIETDEAEPQGALATEPVAADPSDPTAVLATARAHLEAGRTDAASDLLLQLIGSGFADHRAQRMLVDVVRALGKPEVARVKCKLLAQKLRLEGEQDVALELERMAQSL